MLCIGSPEFQNIIQSQASTGREAIIVSRRLLTLQLATNAIIEQSVQLLTVRVKGHCKVILLNFSISCCSDDFEFTKYKKTIETIESN